MQRRQFLQLAGATAALETAPKPVATRTQDSPAGHTFQGEFHLGSESWKVYEDLTKQDGSITFVSSQGVRHLLEQASTRWGRVNFRISGNSARVELAKAGAPRELHVKFHVLVANRLQSATVNGISARIGGFRNDTVIIETGSRRSFVIAVELG